MHMHVAFRFDASFKDSTFGIWILGLYQDKPWKPEWHNGTDGWYLHWLNCAVFLDR